MKWIISKAKWYHPNDGDIENDDLITLTDQEYSALMAEYSKKGKEFYSEDGVLKIRDMKTYGDDFYNQQQLDAESLAELNATDWQVIRELERLYLSGTDLNIRREELRAAIVRPNLPE